MTMTIIMNTVIVISRFMMDYLIKARLAGSIKQKHTCTLRRTSAELTINSISRASH